jgi:DNA-binding IclR family transcriptional regulator
MGIVITSNTIRVLEVLDKDKPKNISALAKLSDLSFLSTLSLVKKLKAYNIVYYNGARGIQIQELGLTEKGLKLVPLLIKVREIWEGE